MVSRNPGLAWGESFFLRFKRVFQAPLVMSCAARVAVILRCHPGTCFAWAVFFCLCSSKRPSARLRSVAMASACLTAADARGVFAQGRIPAVMGADFPGGPVAANQLGQLCGAPVFFGEAGRVKAVFLRDLHHFAGPQFLPLAPDRDQLPAAAESGLLRTHAHALEPAPFQPPMLLAPAGIIFSGKKKAAAASFGPVPKSRFGCL